MSESTNDGLAVAMLLLGLVLAFLTRRLRHWDAPSRLTLATLCTTVGFATGISMLAVSDSETSGAIFGAVIGVLAGHLISSGREPSD